MEGLFWLETQYAISVLVRPPEYQRYRVKAGVSVVYKMLPKGVKLHTEFIRQGGANILAEPLIFYLSCCWMLMKMRWRSHGSQQVNDKKSTHLIKFCNWYLSSGSFWSSLPIKVCHIVPTQLMINYQEDEIPETAQSAAEVFTQKPWDCRTCNAGRQELWFSFHSSFSSLFTFS